MNLFVTLLSFLFCQGLIAATLSPSDLGLSVDIQEVSTAKDSNNKVYRYIYSKVDVYPSLQIEYFEPGGEGDSLEVLSIAKVTLPSERASLSEFTFNEASPASGVKYQLSFKFQDGGKPQWCTVDIDTASPRNVLEAYCDEYAN